MSEIKSVTHEELTQATEPQIAATIPFPMTSHPETSTTDMLTGNAHRCLKVKSK